MMHDTGEREGEGEGDGEMRDEERQALQYINVQCTMYIMVP